MASAPLPERLSRPVADADESALRRALLAGVPRSPGGPAWLIVLGSPVMLFGAFVGWMRVLAALTG